MPKIRLMAMLMFLIMGFGLDFETVYAVGTNVVSTDVSVIGKSGDETYLIPVFLSGNSGIMGFRIQLQYDAGVGRILAIERGSITQSGNFSTDLNSSQNQPSVSVLWNGTEDVKEDGSLFYLAYQCADKDIPAADIQVSYSQPDTFNAQYKDVKLNCRTISLRSKENGAEQGIRELAEREADLKKSLINLVKSYNQESAVPEEKIKISLVQVLDRYGWRSISDVREEESTRFWKDVKKDLAENRNVSEDILDGMDIQERCEQLVLQDLDFEKYGSAKAEKKTAQISREVSKDNRRVYIFLAVCAAIVLLLFLSVLFYRKKKNVTAPEIKK